MQYWYTHHASNSRTVLPAESSFRVLLSEPEPEALALYARHLARADLVVHLCPQVDGIVPRVHASRPHVIVINPLPDVATSVRVLQHLNKTVPGIPVITVSPRLSDENLDQLMGAAVVLHINKSFSQPRDIVIAVRQVLGIR